MIIPIFIGNLNFETNHKTLMKLLEEYGNILSLKIETDKFTQRSKGFAKATVEDRETAEKIISALNGAVIDGRIIRVEIYKSD